MKYKILISIVALIITAILFDFKEEAHGSSNGAPTIVTGSPGDGNNTCAKSNCHTGSSVVVSPGWITSNIPAGGYTHGTTYTVTATATEASLVKFGFEISPQSASGTLVGTLVAGPGTQLTGGGKYITHSSSGTMGTMGSHTWTFSWTAPATGNTPFTFYGAFNCSNNNAMKTGDIIHTSTLAVIPSSVGIEEIADKATVNLFPNPINDALTLEYTLATASPVSVTMFDLQGRKIADLISEKEKNAGKYTATMDMNSYQPGMYFITLAAGNAVSSKKVMIVR